jgi:flagella basal body P-ring formation protein FlgA
MTRFALVAALLLAAPALGQSPLRPVVVVTGEAVTLGDLVADAGPHAATALFRAPDLGSHGVIQAWRIVEAARAYGVEIAAPAALAEVRVERQGRAVGEVELAELLAAEAMTRFGLVDRTKLDLRIDGIAGGPVLDAGPAATLAVERFNHDPGSTRFEALVVAVDGARRSRPLRVTGSAADYVDAVRLRRAVTRGEIVQGADLVTERLPRGRLPADAAAGGGEVAGRAARRSMGEGTLVRASDLERPRVVQRGEPVTIVFEGAHFLVTARGRALDAAGVGETIDVQNAASRRTLQATVTGPGRVVVRIAGHRRVAATASPQTTQAESPR